MMATAAGGTHPTGMHSYSSVVKREQDFNVSHMFAI